jgi:lipopolysaccharide export system ATP-binding protein
MHARARLGLGYLPQEPSIFRHLSVEENILAILEAQPDVELAEQKKRLEELLEELHVGHLRRNRGDSLSGGERRRVEIARALASDPRFILLDEPFAGVDPISIIDIKKIVCYLSERNIGVLITDHNVRETLDICDRAYIVSEGRMIAEGRPEAILRDDRVREVYLGHDFKL